MKKSAKNKSAEPEEPASTISLDLILKIVGALVAVVGVVFGLLILLWLMMFKPF